MRKALIAVITLTLLFSLGSFAASKKPLCIVANFETSGGASKNLSESTARLMMTALTYVGDYKVVSFKKQAKAMESLNKKKGANISASDAKDLAALVEADVVVTGKITKNGNEYDLSVKFLDGGTGEVIKSGSSSRKYSSSLSKSIDDILGLT
jgi:hypothetical protein